MRASLSLGVSLLALVALIDFFDSRAARAPRAAGAGRGAGLHVVAAAKGRLLPEATYGTGPEVIGNVIWVDDASLAFRDDPEGLRVATLSPTFEIEAHELFDVAASAEDVERFLARVADDRLGALIVVASTGRIEPDGDEARAALRAAALELGSAVDPFETSPVSWALVAVRRRSGWVLLAESFSRDTGAVVAFTVERDTSVYDGYRGETLFSRLDTEVEIHLYRHLDSAAAASPRVDLRVAYQVGRVFGPSIYAPVPAKGPGFVRWQDVALGRDPVFTCGIGLRDGAWTDSDGAIFSLLIDGEPVHTETLSADPPPASWVPWRVDLARWAGRTVEVELRVEPRETTDRDWALWLEPTLRFERQ